MVKENILVLDRLSKKPNCALFAVTKKDYEKLLTKLSKNKANGYEPQKPKPKHER